MTLLPRYFCEAWMICLPMAVAFLGHRGKPRMNLRQQQQKHTVRKQSECVMKQR
jgi:hypothetical protein